MIDATRKSEALRPILVWFRNDLRLSDNPALAAAVASGRPVIPVLVDDRSPARRPRGAASAWWLDRSLDALAQSLGSRGSRLILRSGDAAEVVLALAAETKAHAVYWNRLYAADQIARDSQLKSTLRTAGVEVKSFNSALLVEPFEIVNGSGQPFKVFTPFWRAARGQMQVPSATPAPDILIAPAHWPASETKADWRLSPQNPDWSQGFSDWRPGEAGAQTALQVFLDRAADQYGARRDYMADAATSRLSPHLAFGEIGPRQIWQAVMAAQERRPETGASLDKFLSEIGWREFSHHLLYQFPDLERLAFKSSYDAFPWRSDPKALRAWKRGQTGYPLVDAGMRELWATGYMHNRARMICASFLVKHLLIDWREGEAHFWDTLVDADRANNAAGWQWVAGSGADAAPYFRIFSPMGQGERFDAEGGYVRRWVPELARLPDGALHAPWLAEKKVLQAAGVRLGETYPLPIVDHSYARQRALEALASLKAADT